MANSIHLHYDVQIGRSNGCSRAIVEVTVHQEFTVASPVPPLWQYTLDFRCTIDSRIECHKEFCILTSKGHDISRSYLFLAGRFSGHSLIHPTTLKVPRLQIGFYSSNSQGTSDSVRPSRRYSRQRPPSQSEITDTLSAITDRKTFRQ
jgi:hypothetical protein